jgi:hypothetical protein
MKKITKYLIVTILNLVLLYMSVIIVSAHGNVLYDISLDWDEELENGVIGAAQEFYGINEMPEKLDYDHELINVKFSRDLEYSVLIHPIDFAVYGYRNDNLISKGDQVLDSQARKTKAEEIFKFVPGHFKKQLRYGGESKLYTGIFQHTWFRYVNGAYVLNDHLQVEVDSVDGDIISWRLSPFFYHENQLPQHPAITSEVAEQIALIYLKAKSLDKDPFLIYEKDRLVWVINVQSLYPIFVGVNAITGELVFSGAIRGDMPPNYDYGKDVEVVQSTLISRIYGEE